jgi:hypothetical protein
MTISLQKIYIDYHAKEKYARTLLGQLDWFCRIADFDPKTGLALPQALTGFLAKVTQPANEVVVLDRVWRITEHSRASVERLFRSLNESPRREQALLAVHSVRELDANSFIKLSNRPGRTIREKLAGKPYMQAVRRFQSIDLPENRLLKAFVRHLAELLELRRDCLGHEDELLQKIQSWLRSEEAQAIGKWDNLPPNNTLLAHRDYRRVWDSWRWLQTLDDDITRDLSQLEERKQTMRRWQQYARMWADSNNLVAEMPLLFDYENFKILTWTSKDPLFKEVKQKMHRHVHQSTSTEPICIDLTVLHPRYASGDRKGAQSLADAFLWQRWQREDEAVGIELFGSDAAWLHPDATTISATDLFFAKDNTTELFDHAARVFTIRLSEAFKNDTLIWLAPDFLNDFELEVIRRNLNARFLDAEPLPRSVAAVFAQADPAKITGEGYSIVVVDSVGGKTTATKVVAKFDKDLAKRLPISKGFYWERCPPVVIFGVEIERHGDYGYDIATVDAKEQWRDAIRPARPSFIEAVDLKRVPGIGNFAFCINLTECPVVGGIRLHALQQQADDIPLWRDQIPELSIKVMKDGRQQRFHLVSRGTTVKPTRGKPVTIPVDEAFTLPDGRLHYSFPLYIGDDANDLGFSARLDSPAFPLKNKAECELNLTFEYGADDPYKLVFSPLDKHFPSIRATWRRTEEIIITDAPAPEYPHPMTWAELRSFPDTKNGGTMDLIGKLSATSANFARWLEWNDEKAWNNITKSIKGWCRFLVIQIWRDGRSATEDSMLSETVQEFRHSLARVLATEKKTTSDIRFLECCMHKDAPDDCVDWIFEQISNGNIREKRATGFSLGDVSEQWQKDLFSKLVANPTNDVLRVFSYAIWREQEFVKKFGLADFLPILNALKIMLGNIKQCPPRKDDWTARNWIRATTEPLELLLGLLRTRASSNPEIKMLLQPHQEITKELAKQVERLTELVALSNITLFSRVQINIEKPEGDRTPDLLYALRLYLTGDDGANAIHISSISDSDND